MAAGSQVGAYRLVKQIGEGGMGAVWLAEHAMLGRRAAIKLLHPTFSSRSDIVTRFFNEARAATAIADPGIVQIYDFGHHVDGTAYIVMELLDGEPLDQRLARKGMLPVNEAIRIVRQVATSLGAAHGRGIIHRDLKPENIFLVRDAEVVGGERAKILDFGIAKLTEDRGLKTQTSALMGTPTYMSPEQCRGAGLVDQRSDVYSLGCVLFTLLVGRVPFDADGAGDIIAMHLREPAPRVSSSAPHVPHAVDQLVARCLAKDPNERFSSGTELAAALGAIASTSSPDHQPATLLAHPASQQATTLSSLAGAVPRSSTGRRAGFVSLGLIVVGAGVLIGLRARSSSQDHEQAASLPQATADAPPAIAPQPPSNAEDPLVTTKIRMRALVLAFVQWSKQNTGAPCPTIAEMVKHRDTSAVDRDGWGHSIGVTCTDQPPDQIVGFVAAGADGARGTTDDVPSWTLDRDVTDLLRGARWADVEVASGSAPSPAKPVRNDRAATRRPRRAATTGSASQSKVESPPTPPVPAKKPAIELDADGMPVRR